jgi:hypothetical protein
LALCWIWLGPASDTTQVTAHFEGRSLKKRETLSTLPPLAAAQVSAALGREQFKYHAFTDGEGLHMQNPDHRLAVNFTPTSLGVRRGAETWQLALQGYGYGAELHGVEHTTPHAIGNRVEYRRDGMTEWYVNGPLGLEQGFTLPRPPGVRSGDVLTLAFTLSGNLIARADEGGKDVTLTRPDGTRALRYRGLTAHDATGRELPAWLEVEGQRLSLHVDDMNADYPVVVDPFIEQAQLTAPDGLPGDQFGFVSIDGDVIVVGAPRDDIGPNIDQGSAYVFVKPAGGWNGILPEPARLIAFDGAGGDTFGGAVAISGDTIVVGARWDDVGGVDQGSAYVFVKPEGGWSGTLNQKTPKLTARLGAANDNFGDWVAIDGDTIVVGARGDDIDTLSDRGSAYVFVKPAGGWVDSTENTTLSPSDSSFAAQFGSSVAIDGDTIVVGALGTSSGRGAAYVFVKPQTGWPESLDPNATLSAADAAVGDLFGVSVAVAGDTVAVGASGDDTGAILNHGSAYVFVMPPGGWSGSAHANAKLTPSNAAAGAEFGNPVAVSGFTIVVGAAHANVAANNQQGSAYVFLRPVGGWNGDLEENDKLNASDGAALDQFGTSVAVSDNVIVVGANMDDVAFPNQGSAYVFLRDDPATLTLSPSELTGPIDLTHTITATVVSVGNRPLRDAIVRFSVSGAVTSAGECTTDATGQCAFTYQGPSTAGTDTIVAFADTNRDGVRDAGEPDGAATKTWVDDDIESDQDADGIGDTVDNCVSVANPSQTDTDGDAQGDACDPDDDNDSVADENDAFPLDASEWVDTDADGTGNNADGDDDNDGVPDATDAFPLNPLESRDSDGDGTGDNADPDDDNDGIPDSIDAFPFDPARGLLMALTPPTDTNTVGTQHCVTALVTGALDSPVPAVTVRFIVTGSIESSGTVATDAGGRAVYCYIGPTLPGADAIFAHADFDGDGAVDMPEPTATATKSWLLPAAGAGQATGGGQTAAVAAVGGIAFGFNAKSSEVGFTGNCNVVDRAASVHIKCIDVISLVRSGNSAMIFGNATVNGAHTTYSIAVQDVGEPGVGADSFTIVTASGYSAGGVLKGGNIQVR